MEFWAWGPFTYYPGFSKQEFWNAVDNAGLRYGFPERALRNSIGCYMLSTTRGQREKPWYIGKTIAKDGFYGEIFTPHKIDHYANALAAAKSNSASITLFSLVTPTQRLSNAGKSNTALINWLEKSLIGMGLSKNTDLLNVRDTRYLKNVWVEGVIGPQRKGRPVSGARIAARALR